MLTIVNCMVWVVVVIGLRTDLLELVLPEFIVCWPLAFFFLPLLWDSEPSAAVLCSVIIGLNSLLWGYGISGLLSLFEKWKAGPVDLRRGFDVILTPHADTPVDDGRDNDGNGRA